MLIRDFTYNIAALSINDIDVPPEPTSYTATLKSPHREQWRAARQVEYQSLLDNVVWEVVLENPSHKPLTTKWVHKYKIGADGTITKHKARAVARGFQQVEGIDYNDTYAPVAKHPTYRILFAIVTALEWTVHQVDIITAFLNSPLRETVYIRPPPGYPEKKGYVLRLLKALYGLKQASKAWYNTLVLALRELRWRVSLYDPCLFMYEKYNLFIVV